MKWLVALFSFVFSVSVCFSSGFAQNNKPTYTAEDVYGFFAQYSPQEVVDFAHLAVKHFSNVAISSQNLSQDKEEEKFSAALDSFNQQPHVFKWENYPLVPAIVPQRCDEFRVVAHPVKQFLKVMNKKGFLQKYKDVKGKKVIDILCKRIESEKQGAWSMQFQWWPQTDKPLTMGFFLLPIPNTPYQIQTFYPTNQYLESELNEKYRKPPK